MAYSVVTTESISHSESYRVKELNLGFQSDLLISIENIPNLELLPNHWLYGGKALKIKYAAGEIAIVEAKSLYLRYSTLLEWAETEEYFLGIKLNPWLWRGAGLPEIGDSISLKVMVDDGT